MKEGEIPSTSTSTAEGENSNANGNKVGQSNQVETRLNNADTTQVSTQGERQYEDGEHGNTDGDSSKKDSVEESYHGGTSTAEKELNTREKQQEDGEQGKTDGDSSKKDSVEEGTNTVKKGTSLRQVESPDKEEVQKQNVHPNHDEHVDIDDIGLDGVKEATEGSPLVIIHNPEQREGKMQENVQSIEPTVVDATSDKMKEQVYVEQDADPPYHSSSEKEMVISHTEHQQVTFCRKSSLVKELYDLISHNIDGLEVQEDVRDLHKEDKENNIKKNKENILKQADISPNSKSNNKGQKKGKKNAIDKKIPLSVVPKRNYTKSNVK
ncbi:uncharacterized protein LOC132637699 [Lycium barbarum]|uniref:uncharacterized protein LOC132637699 n=1 Tax=Lycium barbarum TaxID=112863 RepID=UPI00293EB3B4|nr:uncharacterized protein LOC132637699 [Lycium barbarum]